MAATVLAPRDRVGQMMGVWFMSISLGNLIAGLVGKEYDAGGQMAEMGQVNYDMLEKLNAFPPSALVAVDDTPVGYIEVYDPTRDVLGAHAPVLPGDIGAHVLMTTKAKAPATTTAGGLLSAAACAAHSSRSLTTRRSSSTGRRTTAPTSSTPKSS